MKGLVRFVVRFAGLLMVACGAAVLLWGVWVWVSDPRRLASRSGRREQTAEELLRELAN